MARFSEFIAPRLLRPDEASRYVGGSGILKRFEEAQWLRPVVRRKRLTLYKRTDLDGCCLRLEEGEFPEAVTRSENAASMP